MLLMPIRWIIKCSYKITMQSLILLNEDCLNSPLCLFLASHLRRLRHERKNKGLDKLEINQFENRIRDCGHC